MKIYFASKLLKALLVLFAIGVVFFGIIILPILAEEMVIMYPELDYAKLPILISTELLLVLLLTGVGIIMYLLVMFDHDDTFSFKFVKGLEILVGMCSIASVGIILIIVYMSSFGGPGPFLSIVMIGTIIVIWIVAAVTLLIRAIIKKPSFTKTSKE
ncbi:MAG: DUF2975 domain-containing protein [Clostridia bacterium]|nr:DUF2975 domain-containing protein [Clostridia bacterium]